MTTLGLVNKGSRCKYHSLSGRQFRDGMEWRLSGSFLRKQTLMQCVLFGLILGWPATLAWAQKPSLAGDLTEISIEKLMDIEVTSVSKKEEKLFQAASAIYVITAEDIRRSGATNIPDLLRMAPGVEVAQIDANTWAISIRGFSSRYSTKVLVLIDGRSVYTPSFSGVYWDQQDVPLEDIDRIEVIRGSGGTVWGANAMNGVINIITKTAKATQGGLLRAGGGSEEAVQGLTQYGGKIGQEGAYRVFGNSSHLGDAAAAGGGNAADGWYMLHGGFRSDWDLSPRDTMTVQGDLYQTSEGQTVTELLSNLLSPAHLLPQTFNDEVSVHGSDILGRWTRTLGNGSDISLQVYFDRYNRRDQGVTEDLDTFDLDFQHHLAIGSRHDIVWGLGYRRTSDDITAGYSVSFFPPQRTYSLFNIFIQDQMRLTKSLSFTLGSKFEHNAYTGFEYEPSARLAWTPTKRQTVWLSASRAIRQPSRSDTALQVDIAAFPAGNETLGVLTLFGNPKIKVEQVRDFEVGYRVQVSKRLSLDIATFLNYYRNLLDTESGAPFFAATPAPPRTVFPLLFDNDLHIKTYGGEVFANWEATSRWRISSGYSVFSPYSFRDSKGVDSSGIAIQGHAAKHHFQIRSLLNLPHNLNWDSAFYFVGGTTDGDIPGYTRLDTRLGWRMGESSEISLVGQNLLMPRHPEFEDSDGLLHTLVRRSIYAKITWRF